jgi:hypothetical protein
MSDDEVLKAGLSWCLKGTRRRNHRALITVVAGKIVEDKKPLEVKKKPRTRVDVSVSQPK